MWPESISRMQNVQQPMPPHITMANSAGASVPPFMETFLVTRSNSYVLSIHGEPHMILNNQKQQSQGPPMLPVVWCDRRAFY